MCLIGLNIHFVFTVLFFVIILVQFVRISDSPIFRDTSCFLLNGFVLSSSWLNFSFWVHFIGWFSFFLRISMFQLFYIFRLILVFIRLFHSLLFVFAICLCCSCILLIILAWDRIFIGRGNFIIGCSGVGVGVHCLCRVIGRIIVIFVI